MAITGTKFETIENKKKVGLGIMEVVGVCMSNQELKEEGFYVKEGTEGEERSFISEKEGVDSVRLEFALKEVKTEEPFMQKISFFLENRERESLNTPGSFQWINNQGTCSYAKDMESLPDWFKAGGDVRKALVGEEQFMAFMRSCMAINFRDGGTLAYDVKKFFKGNFKELKADLKSDFLSTVIVAFTVKERDVMNEETGEAEKKEYQNFYNKAFAPGSQAKFLNNKREFTEADVEKLFTRVESNDRIKEENKGKAPAERKKLDYLSMLETLVVTMASPEYPCKDRYYLGILKDYNPSEDFIGSGKTIDETSMDY